MSLVTFGDLTYVSYPVVPLRWLCAIARLQGSVRYLMDKRSASAVRNNLAGVKGKSSDEELQAMTRRFFEYESLRNSLFILSPKLTDEKLLQLFSVDGIERLDKAIAAGKGVILLASHLNPMSTFMLVMLLRRRGYDIRVAFTEDHDHWSSSRFRRLLRRITGDRSYFEHVGGFQCQLNIRPIVRVLTQGAVVAQTGDGWHSAGYVDVDFLNRRLPFTTGMVRIAQETGAMIVPVFAAGAPPDQLRFMIEEPYSVPKGEPVDACVAAYAKRLEHYLMERPECWAYWFVPDALEKLAGVRNQTLENRYKS